MLHLLPFSDAIWGQNLQILGAEHLSVSNLALILVLIPVLILILGSWRTGWGQDSLCVSSTVASVRQGPLLPCER